MPMIQLQALQNKLSISTGDLPVSAIAEAKYAGMVAWDIETSGLNWKHDKIGVCQIYVPDVKVYVVRMNGIDAPRSNLISLLCDEAVCKIFHHAMFDLRFMVHHWSIEPRNVVCTKVASKILNPLEKDHSLKRLLRQYLNVYLDKHVRVSNWLHDQLSTDQVSYAANDVLYLPELFHKLHQLLESCSRWDLAQESFHYLPVRVKLDLIGAEDVFKYSRRRL